MKDYYSILGINREANINEIKMAYKRLAMKYHPDRNQDDSSEEKFKEINEAYMVLSCPKKKSEYDSELQYGNEQNYQNNYQNYNYSYEDNSEVEYNVNMEISLEESQLGAKKNASIPIIMTCDYCRGLKFDPYKKTFRCFKCDGRGYEINRDSYFVFQKTCYYCNGKGYYSKDYCPKCNGLGNLNKTEQIEIDIPKYSETGDKIFLNNVIKLFNGKIIVNIFVKKHEFLNKIDNNLHVNCDVFFTNFLLGKSFLVRTLFNGIIRVKFPYLNKKIFEIKNFGLISKNGEHGNLYIHVKVKFPLVINDNQKKILLALNKAFN
ncbi:DnaJ domain-containing protein [Candidatus Vidania fulgoroideorum]